MDLKGLRALLQRVVPKVYYAFNAHDNEDVIDPPFILYQEISKRAPDYAEDRPLYFIRVVQITLISKTKDVELEAKLEKELLKHRLVPNSLYEFRNDDGSINKIYEVRLEVF